jgi:hypothetical protein
MSMSASEALDYALNHTTELGPIPRVVLIYVADTGSMDTHYLVRRTGCSPADVERAIALLSSAGHLEAIRGRWAA